MTLVEALNLVVSESRNPYAINYVRGLPLVVEMYGEEGKRDNILRILCNLGGWRGETARAVKLVLKGVK
jgi:hypothetical protein